MSDIPALEELSTVSVPEQACTGASWSLQPGHEIVIAGGTILHLR